MAKNPLIRSFSKKANKPLPNKSAGNLEDYVIRKVINTKEGTITKIPVDDNDITNKSYVDSVSGGAHTESSTDSLTNKTIDDFSNKVDADEVHIKIRNESGSTMTK